MSADTLSAIRDRIESLAVADGGYIIVCGRTGERPVPVEDKRFPDRDTAVAAAQTATAYRSVLRQYDPRAPVYDLVVCEAGDTVAERPGPPENRTVEGSEGTEGSA